MKPKVGCSKIIKIRPPNGVLFDEAREFLHVVGGSVEYLGQNIGVPGSTLPGQKALAQVMRRDLLSEVWVQTVDHVKIRVGVTNGELQELEYGVGGGVRGYDVGEDVQVHVLQIHQACRTSSSLEIELGWS